jgi:hypothetical protein
MKRIVGGGAFSSDIRLRLQVGFSPGANTVLGLVSNFQMFDSTSKIASINSFREPETFSSAGGQKRKPQPKHVALLMPPNDSPDSDDEHDEHELDTLA